MIAGPFCLVQFAFLRSQITVRITLKNPNQRTYGALKRVVWLLLVDSIPISDNAVFIS